MKNKIKKWHIALMSLMALFVAVFTSMFSLRADTVDEETGETLTDNWKLGLVFYDSTVDNGKTPLTEINWDASDGSYKDGTPRVITVQINYKNTSAVTTYQPGELEISIPNLIYSSYNKKGTAYDAQWTTSVVVGANDATHTKYDWNFITGTSPSNSQSTFTFTNANTIEENANFEGSIQIQYTITPRKEHDSNVERYEDECIHTFAKVFQALLHYDKMDVNNEITSIDISSNKLEFNYTRKYLHPWKQVPYYVYKKANKISSYDGLPTGANNYIWVKYSFEVKSSPIINNPITGSYPYIGCGSSLYITDTFPSECLVLYTNGDPIENNENNYKIPYSKMKLTSAGGSAFGCLNSSIYVGYPKSIYNTEAGNMEFINTANLYGTYTNEKEIKFLDDSSININLNNFEFSYTGNLYGISKTGKTWQQLSNYNYISSYTSPDMIYQSIIDNNGQNLVRWTISPTVWYTESPMTVIIGDDLIYASNKNNNYEKLDDTDYYFKNIKIPSLKNCNNENITTGKYDCELWIRYAEDENYTLFSEFKNKAMTFSFDSNNVVAWYLQINDMKEGIKNISITTDMIFTKTDILESGTIYNFDYLKVYFKNSENILELQNSCTIDNYANYITKEEIATYDLQFHNSYIQRATASVNWAYYTMFPIAPAQNISKQKDGNITQDPENEVFIGAFSLSAKFLSTKWDSTISNKHFLEQLQDDDYQTNIILYDLLPYGMNLESTIEEIIETCNCDFAMIWNFERQRVLTDEIEREQFFKEHTSISINTNWKNSGRTLLKITIDFSDYPLFFRGHEHVSGGGVVADQTTSINFKYDYSVSYESYLEYGNTYINHLYAQSTDNISNLNSSKITDNGQYDIDATDINNDGNTEDKILHTQASTTITSVVSTHQDVTTYVKTDQSNYSAGIVDASGNSEYEYKLRVRTGSADVTNLVIYTSIEEAQPKKTRWYGEFLGVDTTYAENKGYTVKVWYSPNKTVGTLAEDTSWQVYDEATVDKSKVKSLAFQYLVETDDTTGTSIDAIDPAVLPANSLTYVLIKMKSPADESETRLARMDCWTQWNALDDHDQPVDFITGINSNVVKVALPNSIKADDLPSISLKFTKEIQGETTDFENLKLNKANEHIFMIRLTSLTANDDGTYNQVTGLLSSTQGLVITQIPIGTYLLEELGDNYFDFVEFTNNNDPEITIEGVTFEKTDQGYIITVSEDLTETVEFNIKVTNEIESKRFFEDKNNEENLFLINKTGIDHNTPED